MAKLSNQKMKLIYLQKIFLEDTDDEHGLTIGELIAKLEEYGISAERKSVYSDIEALKTYGLDIYCKREKTVRYYLGNRDFQLAELKLLVDAIQSSRFITVKKSSELIGKLEKLASIHEGQLLQRQVYVLNRVKTMNEQIYYNTDKLHTAISQNRQIRFKYCETVLDFKASRRFVKREKRNGEPYTVSPWALSWENENYYLIAFDHESQQVRHYRVDKMESISILDSERTCPEELENTNPAEYSKRIFSMFGGRESTVTLRFDNSLAGVAADKFGNDVFISACNKEYFEIKVTVEISVQFYAWLAGLGKSARITAPAQEAENFRRYLEEIVSSYQ